MPRANPKRKQCRPLRFRGGAPFHAAERAFTLLELLVILVIVGLVSAVAVPQLSTLSDRVAFALNREKLERALSQMPYQAFKRREDLILGAPEKPQLGESGPAAFEMASQVAMNGQLAASVSVEGPILLSQAMLDIPEGWRLEAETPIIYRASGLCSGGELRVRVGDTSFLYDLRAPACVPQQK